MFSVLSIARLLILPAAFLALPSQAEPTATATPKKPATTSLHVDPVRGSDANDGSTPAKAFATLEKARDTIREQALNRHLTRDFVVLLRGGRYELTRSFVLDERDSGSNEFSVIYRAWPGETPILSGGRQLTGWKKVDGKPYWKTSAPVSAGFTDWFWQLYVNGVRAERARSNTPHKMTGKGFWDDPATPEMNDGFLADGSHIKHYTNPEDIRCSWLFVFKNGEVPVSQIMPAENGNILFKMRQPAFQIWTEWKDGMSRCREFFVINAFEELDEPGEWYLNRKTREVFYYPYQRDNMETAEVRAPSVETLLRFSGKPGIPVRHIKVDGLTLEYGQWLDPQNKLLGRSQAEAYLGDTLTYSSQVPGQVILDHTEDVDITGCTIRHMGSCGLQTYEACHRITIEGNHFEDLTAAAVTIGRFWSKQNEHPNDTVSTDLMIRNNIVRNTGRDYPQGTGINIFSAKYCYVHHNDISDTAYSSLHTRFSDGPRVNPAIGRLEFKWNKVSRGLQFHRWGLDDGGQLYCHGPLPGTVFAENYSLYANRSAGNEFYSDNWSNNITWSRNVSRFSHSAKPYFAWHPGNVEVVFDGNFMEDRTKSDAKPATINAGKAKVNDMHLVRNDDYPEEARRIMENAGLEAKWKRLESLTYGHDNLAQGKPLSTSSSPADLPATLGVDGKWNTFCTVTPDAKGEAWYQVDLGKPTVLGRITILPRQDRYEEASQKNIEVVGSNDPGFARATVLCEQNEVPWYRKANVESHISSNEWEKYIPVMPGFRYIRVRRTKSGIPFGFGEFAVYGRPPIAESAPKPEPLPKDG